MKIRRASLLEHYLFVIKLLDLGYRVTNSIGYRVTGVAGSWVYCDFFVKLAPCHGPN